MQAPYGKTSFFNAAHGQTGDTFSTTKKNTRVRQGELTKKKCAISLTGFYRHTMDHVERSPPVPIRARGGAGGDFSQPFVKGDCEKFAPKVQDLYPAQPPARDYGLPVGLLVGIDELLDKELKALNLGNIRGDRGLYLPFLFCLRVNCAMR